MVVVKEGEDQILELKNNITHMNKEWDDGVEKIS